MKHATVAGLKQIEGLLDSIRYRKALKERSPGVFYLRSRAFLHFHEDPAGLFADVRTNTDWKRLPVNTKDDQTRLLRMIRAHLSDDTAS